MATNVVEQVGAAAAAKSASLMEIIHTLTVEYSFRIFGALATLIIGFWVVRILKNILIKMMKHHDVDQTLIGFVSGLVHIGLKVIVFIAALGVLKVPVASLVAVLGAAGLAVGLALQGSLSNFAAGVLMIIFKPFKVTDVVEAGGVLGTVREIGILTTHVDTLDNKMTIVPNAKVMSDNITNLSANNTRRVDITAGISYGDDIDRARSAIVEVLQEVPHILDTPAPDVLVSEMADSSVNFAVRPWCDPANYWDVYFGVTEGIKKKFDERGVTIPFPQRDVHVYEHKGE